MQIRKIYVDNYRGFKDTYIPLAQVNFLVGENSTGKTSILKLVDLFASSDFWFNGEFRTKNVDFSYYGDLTDNNKDVRTKICLELGSTDKKTNQSSYAKIILRSGVNSQTTVSAIEISNGKVNFQVKMSPSSKNVKYKVTKTDSDERVFVDWCQKEIDETGFKVYKKDLESFYLRSPYFLVYQLAAEEKESESLPSFMNRFQSYSWVAPIRVKPQQTYDGNVYEYSAEGEDTPYRLKNLYSRKLNEDSKRSINAIEKFGKESGLYDSIHLNKYANSGNAPFSIDIVRGGEIRHLTDVGYGVSQVLPILVSVVLNEYASTYEIQQPEVHLHPRAQASLGGLLYDIADNQKSRFLIETHSDFIIDRFRQKLSSSKKSEKPTAQALFFSTLKGKNKAYPIAIDDNGNYAEDQPDDFRRFFLNEELKNISI